MLHKVITATEAALLIKSGNTIGTSGFIMTGVAEEVFQAVEKRFLETGEPRDLTLTFGASQSNPQTNSGLNRWCKETMLKCVIGAHFNLQKDLAELISREKIEAYCIPQGVLMHLFRAIGGRKPGVLSSVGLKTFVDPRVEGGRLNKRSTAEIVELHTLGGKEYLWYKPFDINIALIRGTYADERGNINCAHEGIRLELLVLALAAKACGGKVIVQVEGLTSTGSLDPRSIVVPGVLVDAIVVAKQENHWQTAAALYNPAYTGEVRVPLKKSKPLALDPRKVVCRRAALELRPDAVINLGIGMPEGVSSVAAEERIIDQLIATVEPGLMGGVPVGGLDFGCAINPEVILDHPSQFDFYDGGGLDMGCLGMAELDAHGNVNVSKFGPRVAGAGGFINISQGAKKVVFCGTFTASGLKEEIRGGKLVILSEGKSKKLIANVEQITFSGEFARENGLNVIYVTERAVFEMSPEGLVLTEIAPGMDLQRDILNQMAFTPRILDPLPLMDARLFREEPMGLAAVFSHPEHI